MVVARKHGKAAAAEDQRRALFVLEVEVEQVDLLSQREREEEEEPAVPTRTESSWRQQLRAVDNRDGDIKLAVQLLAYPTILLNGVRTSEQCISFSEGASALFAEEPEAFQRDIQQAPLYCLLVFKPKKGWHGTDGSTNPLIMGSCALDLRCWKPDTRRMQGDIHATLYDPFGASLGTLTIKMRILRLDEEILRHMSLHADHRSHSELFSSISHAVGRTYADTLSQPILLSEHNVGKVPKRSGRAGGKEDAVHDKQSQRDAPPLIPRLDQNTTHDDGNTSTIQIAPLTQQQQQRKIRGSMPMAREPPPLPQDNFHVDKQAVRPPPLTFHQDADRGNKTLGSHYHVFKVLDANRFQAARHPRNERQPSLADNTGAMNRAVHGAARDACAMANEPSGRLQEAYESARNGARNRLSTSPHSKANASATGSGPHTDRLALLDTLKEDPNLVAPLLRLLNMELDSLLKTNDAAISASAHSSQVPTSSVSVDHQRSHEKAAAKNPVLLMGMQEARGRDSQGERVLQLLRPVASDNEDLGAEKHAHITPTSVATPYPHQGKENNGTQQARVAGDRKKPPSTAPMRANLQPPIEFHQRDDLVADDTAKAKATGKEHQNAMEPSQSQRHERSNDVRGNGAKDLRQEASDHRQRHQQHSQHHQQSNMRHTQPRVSLPIVNDRYSPRASRELLLTRNPGRSSKSPPTELQKASSSSSVARTVSVQPRPLQQPHSAVRLSQPRADSASEEDRHHYHTSQESSLVASQMAHDDIKSPASSANKIMGYLRTSRVRQHSSPSPQEQKEARYHKVGAWDPASTEPYEPRTRPHNPRPLGKMQSYTDRLASNRHLRQYHNWRRSGEQTHLFEPQVPSIKVKLNRTQALRQSQNLKTNKQGDTFGHPHMGVARSEEELQRRTEQEAHNASRFARASARRKHPAQRYGPSAMQRYSKFQESLKGHGKFPVNGHIAAAKRGQALVAQKQMVSAAERKLSIGAESVVDMSRDGGISNGPAADEGGVDLSNPLPTQFFAEPSTTALIVPPSNGRGVLRSSADLADGDDVEPDSLASTSLIKRIIGKKAPQYDRSPGEDEERIGDGGDVESNSDVDGGENGGSDHDLAATFSLTNTLSLSGPLISTQEMSSDPAFAGGRVPKELRLDPVAEGSTVDDSDRGEHAPSPQDLPSMTASQQSIVHGAVDVAVQEQQHSEENRRNSLSYSTDFEGADSTMQTATGELPRLSSSRRSSSSSSSDRTSSSSSSSSSTLSRSDAASSRSSSAVPNQGKLSDPEEDFTASNFSRRLSLTTNSNDLERALEWEQLLSKPSGVEENSDAMQHTRRRSPFEDAELDGFDDEASFESSTSPPQSLTAPGAPAAVGLPSIQSSLVAGKADEQTDDDGNTGRVGFVRNPDPQPTTSKPTQAASHGRPLTLLERIKLERQSLKSAPST